ncbi:MAG TPA: glycosyltransferase family 4 protein, partial [Anaerovoracaceae bacterium]|nr:glycosyltransferase family 4 protein [Anaerovoracaceae bacterium]
DLVIMPTPPITFAGVMDFISKRDHSKSYLILRDIFPQNAKDLGLMKSKLLFCFFRNKEKYMYRVAEHIGCMSQGNIDYVLRHNPEVDASKFELLPNWSNLNEEKPNMLQDYKAKYGLKGKFVCVFGGNIGWPQELEFLIELAKEYRQRKDLVFLIIGKGVLAQKVRKIIDENRLSNVIMKDFLPREDYDGLVSQCEVGLINLDRRFTIPNIPSKTLGYFNAEIPILASVDANTDYGKILEDAKAGLWSVTGDLNSYKKNLEFYLENEEERLQMGKNGKQYLKDHLTTNQAYHTIAKHI